MVVLKLAPLIALSFKMHVWIGLIMFLSLGLELWLAPLGVAVPATFICGFYFTLAYGWRRVLPYLAVYSVLLELALGRRFPVMLLSCFLVAFGASIWRRYGNLKSIFPQLVPGFCVGLVAALSNLLYIVVFSLLCCERIFPFNPAPLLMQIAFGALLLPLYCFLLDLFAYRLNFRRYRNAQIFSEEDSENG